jgi:hypothetical protein
MAITKQEISDWFDRALFNGCSHLIIVCDTFDWEDYPVYVMPNESVHEKASEFDGRNMQKVMEVYSMKLDKQSQMNEYRGFHYE